MSQGQSGSTVEYRCLQCAASGREAMSPASCSKAWQCGHQSRRQEEYLRGPTSLHSHHSGKREGGREEREKEKERDKKKEKERERERVRREGGRKRERTHFTAFTPLQQ